MDDTLFRSGTGAEPGYRLHKLELLNWGTFDSTRGNVHTVRPEGVTTLLIGQNGSGKSTVVDALLTLLVRPVVRNYNVAAGARKQERDERSYIRGAYGRTSRDDDNRAEVQFLRQIGKSYSAILACFCNEREEAFTLAEILHLAADGSVHKAYCYADGERSVSGDISNLDGADRLRQQMVKRGFRVTSTYNEYHGWFSRRTGMRAKAMDMLNQTVAVKDIHSLNQFIREHMLEAQPWRERVEALQNHFTQLREAHQNLVRVRRQSDLLEPIVDKGELYQKQAADLAQAERMLDAADSFFRTTTVQILTPLCDRFRGDIAALKQRIITADGAIAEVNNEIRALANEMEQAGGERLRTIPLLIKTHMTAAQAKRDKHLQLQVLLRAAGVSDRIDSTTALSETHSQLTVANDAIQKKRASLSRERDECLIAHARLKDGLIAIQEELLSLAARSGNLPTPYVEVRGRICEGLRIPAKDLAFVAELVAVKPDENGWRSSIEMVLRRFAFTLLVPQRYYAIVSRYIDGTKLVDARGSGQRLVYVCVSDRALSPLNRPVLRPESMLRKLHYQEGHLLLPWVRAELEDRFDYRCCNTIEEFQAAVDQAMTRERHVKTRGARHEKDDRDLASDPSRFVLGWDNREKRRYLVAEHERSTAETKSLADGIDRCDTELRRLQEVAHSINAALAIRDFDEIDYESEEREIRLLEDERRALEEGSNTIRIIKQRHSEAQAKLAASQLARDDLIREERDITQNLGQAEDMIAAAKRILVAREASGTLERHMEAFAALGARVSSNDLDIRGLIETEAKMRNEIQEEVVKLRTEVDPLRGELTDLMGRYLREMPEASKDLESRIEYLDSFVGLYQQIRKDDLPRYEARFKERLNENITHEIGLLNGAFHTEKSEIVAKIAVLNQSLRQLEYRAGTYMRLEPRPVRDPEILDFQEKLRQCLAGTFEGTPQADEARYVLIERFLQQLRDDERWCDKVTDVRRWFDFVAIESDIATDTSRAYFEDSSGQSGGEKAKLAFTILVAAIAYQYDIDPALPCSDRFRFVVVDEMFSKVDDQYSQYALELFRKFGLQLLIVAPLDAKARVTEPYVGCYLHVVKDERSSHSEIYSMTAREFEDASSELAVKP